MVCLAFVVMQTLFYLPFFVLEAQTFINPASEGDVYHPVTMAALAALLGFIAYRLNQQCTAPATAGCMKRNR